MNYRLPTELHFSVSDARSFNMHCTIVHTLPVFVLLVHVLTICIDDGFNKVQTKLSAFVRIV